MPASTLRTSAIVIVALGTVAAGGIRGLRTARGAPLARNAVMEAIEARFSTLRGRLPAATPLGFVSPLDPTDPAYVMRHMLARYALVPMTLDSSDVHPIALADFDDDEALTRYVARVGGTIVAHPRPGLALVTRPPFTP